MMEEYVVGEPNPPWWAKRGLSAYRKPDGSVGYEFGDGKVFYILNKGDILTKDRRKIRRRKG